MIDDLLRLPTDELNDVIDECRDRENTSELGAQALAAALEASRTPLAGLLAASGDEEDDR